MSLLRLQAPGFDLQTQLTISQGVVAAGAGATLTASGNICTFTTNAAHNLTLNPAAGVPPNYYVMFGGSTSALTGSGILVGNIFRILSIPSTTTFTFYSTVTGGTVTSTTVIPVFFAPFTAQVTSQWGGPNPTQTISATVTPFPPANLEGAYAYVQLGSNCKISHAPNITSGGQFNNSIIPLDSLTTAAMSGGNTPSTAPTLVDISAVSTNFAGYFFPNNVLIQASAAANTTTISVVN